jgi:alpha-glucosidase
MDSLSLHTGIDRMSRDASSAALALSALFGTTLPGLAQGQTVSSPDHAVVVRVQLDPLTYSVSMRNRPVVAPSALGLTLRDQPSFGAWKLLHGEQHTVDRTWIPVWGKTKQIRDRYTEMDLALEEQAAPHRRMDVLVRAYPDGVAFRYVLPRQAGVEHFIVTKELTSFQFPAGATAWAGITESYHHSFGHEYVKQPVAAIPPEHTLSCPC